MESLFYAQIYLNRGMFFYQWKLFVFFSQQNALEWRLNWDETKEAGPDSGFSGKTDFDF